MPNTKLKLIAKSKPIKKVQIKQMAKTFLYLPLYYAINENFFEYLDQEPYKYEFTTSEVTVQTDQEVFEILAKPMADNNVDIYFGIGDPRSLVDRASDVQHDQTSQVALIGALITGTAFWAIDHGTSESRTKTAADLCNFEQIVAYEKGTTSYNLAKTILSDAQEASTSRNLPGIQTCSPNQEFTILKNNQSRHVILSPNVLKVSQIVQQGYSLELCIGSFFQHSDILLTAIATTDGTVRNYPTMVEGFAKGVQQAIFEIHARTPKLIDYACEEFGCDRKTIENALDLADESRVFPSFITLNESLWMRALTGHLRLNGERPNIDDEVFFKKVYKNVGKKYEKQINYALYSFYSKPSNNDPGWFWVVEQADVFGLLYLLLISCTAIFILPNKLVMLMITYILILIVYFIGQNYFLHQVSGKLKPRFFYWFFAAGFLLAIIYGFYTNLMHPVADVVYPLCLTFATTVYLVIVRLYGNKNGV